MEHFEIKIFTVLALFICSANSIHAHNYKIPIEVSRVIDGDTIEAKIDDNIFKVRFINIDCMETIPIHRAYTQAYKNKIDINEVIKKGQIAKNYLTLLIKTSEKNFYIEFKGIDIYGRALGIFYIGDSNINQDLLNKNYCLPYSYKKN